MKRKVKEIAPGRALFEEMYGEKRVMDQFERIPIFEIWTANFGARSDGDSTFNLEVRSQRLNFLYQWFDIRSRQSGDLS
jgi:hypothetical protein